MTIKTKLSEIRGAFASYAAGIEKIALQFMCHALELVTLCYVAQFVYIGRIANVEKLAYFSLVERAKQLDESLVCAFLLALVLGVISDKVIKEKKSGNNG